jgi:hypothetical protein
MRYELNEFKWAAVKPMRLNKPRARRSACK